ncbi:MAG: ornithine carbamoyltransferase, partial [Candidatus Margulisbacteria bacterium]|nr:ornithine carbamoyltransferase [Candidatus Margulisiibacteriota bacterium]
MHLLSIDDLAKETLFELIQSALELKKANKTGTPHPYLKGKSLAMIFEKPSNRTRVSFEIGMFQLGGHAIPLDMSTLMLGQRETVADVGHTLSRYVDGIMYRSNQHKDIVSLSEAASVPVINGLSDKEHPCQALADLLTIYEKLNTFKNKKLCYIGDGN